MAAPALQPAGNGLSTALLQIRPAVYLISTEEQIWELGEIMTEVEEHGRDIEVPTLRVLVELASE